MAATRNMATLPRQGLGLVAIIFGLVTVLAGGSVLSGTDPGYTVFWPLLVFNTAMGLAYAAAGVLIWRGQTAGAYLAGTILVLNLVVLGIVSYRYATAGDVAIDSVRAMILRTVVWLLLLLGVIAVSRRSRLHPPGSSHTVTG